MPEKLTTPGDVATYRLGFTDSEMCPNRGTILWRSADRVVSDIVFDFSVKPRLNSDRGNAMLVASSIYEACKYFTLFQKTVFRNHCAVITSYNPQARDITKEDTGANTETDRQFIYETLS